MNPDQIKRILEAAILSASEPVNVERLALLFTDEERPSNAELRTLLDQMIQSYEERGISLQKVATGYRFAVQADITQRLSAWLESRPVRYSRALLETLALIAYRQPVTRAEIEDIRGVAVSSGIMRTLLEREWIHVVGHRDVPGKPSLYATTHQFLNDLNLRSLSELPALMEMQDEPGTEQLALELEVDVEAATEQPAETTEAEQLTEATIEEPVEMEAEQLTEAATEQTAETATEESTEHTDESAEAEQLT